MKISLIDLLTVTLTVVFITLKLVGAITWSWWWVVSPILFSMGWAIFLILLLAVASAFVKTYH